MPTTYEGSAIYELRNDDKEAAQVQALLAIAAAIDRLAEATERGLEEQS